MDFLEEREALQWGPLGKLQVIYSRLSTPNKSLPPRHRLCAIAAVAGGSMRLSSLVSQPNDIDLSGIGYLNDFETAPLILKAVGSGSLLWRKAVK